MLVDLSPIIGGVYIVGGVLAVVYLYLWFHNTEAAIRLTEGILRGLAAVLMALGRALMAIIMWVVNAFR